MGYRRLHLGEGWVEYLDSGPEDAPGLLLFHVGTPSAAVMYTGLVGAAAGAGLRVATYSRPGYGASPRREGRTVADEAGIAAALADRLGYERFFTIGWSGGGPAALACAALLPDRVPAAMALASVAPVREAGAESGLWTDEELREWDDLAAGRIARLLPDVEAAAARFGRMTPARLQTVGGTPDARALGFRHATEIVPALTRSMRRAMLKGYEGFLDDHLAQARAWGFHVADIRVPVVVRHGELDRLVPVGHGRWLADAIPGARGIILPDAGHGSIVLPWEELVGQLLEVAG